MNRFLLLIILFSISAWSQTETELIKKYTTDFEKVDNLFTDNSVSVESSILHLDSLMTLNKNEPYLINTLKLYKASQERRINPKKALIGLQEVQSFLNQNPQYNQLQLFKNTISGRIAFEVQQDCKTAFKLYEENLQAMSSEKSLYKGWNIALETKTGLINTLLCLQHDQEALQYLKQLEKEIDPKTQLKEYLYVLSVSGYIHTKFSNYKEGENYFKKVVTLLENSKDHLDNYLAACNNLAHIYKVTENTTDGIKILEKALAKSKEINDTNGLLLVSNNLGFLYVKQERYKEAETLGLDILKQSNDKQFAIHKANADRLLGTVYYYLGDYQKAENYIDEAIDFFKNFKNPELLRNALDVKNKLLIKTGEFEDAARVNSEIISMLDSVNLSKNVQNLQRELVAYETEKKNNEITILKQKEDINTFNIEKQKQQIKFLGIGLLVVLLFSSIIFWYQKKINTIQNLSLRSKLTRSQFNPHYINNAFTSLQAELVDHNFDETLIDYTSNISRFSRLLLESTFRDEWSLYEEKQMMENYLKTQQYRLQGGFQYQITSTLNSEELHKLKIPSAITQSVLENAIEHGGFKNNSKEGKINIYIDKIENQLLIIIKNNIIGEPITISKKLNNEPSRGLDITKQRMLLHSKIYRKLAGFKFSQLQNEVKVEFNLPILTA